MTDKAKTPASTDSSRARAAAKDYLAKYDGPTMMRNLEYGSRLIKQIYKRDCLILPRNILFITYFSRMTFEAQYINTLEDKLMERIKKVVRKFEMEMEQAKVVMKTANLTEEDMCSNNLPEKYEVVVTSPMYNQCLVMMTTGDKLINYFDTLWMNGQITTEEYRQQCYQVKRAIRGIITFVRNTWIELQKRIHSDKLDAINDEAGATADAKADKAEPQAEATAAADGGDTAEAPTKKKTQQTATKTAEVAEVAPASA